MSAEHMRAWRARKMAAGLCSRCGWRPRVKRGKTCKDCRATGRKYVEDKRYPSPQETHVRLELDVSQGRCAVCGLLEPHECLDSYSGLATSRPGPREAGLYTMKHPRGA